MPDEMDDLLQTRALLWESIEDVCATLLEDGNECDITRFATILLDTAERWKALAVEADDVCRWVLLTDADRYVTTAMELRLHLAA